MREVRGKGEKKQQKDNGKDQESGQEKILEREKKEQKGRRGRR